MGNDWQIQECPLEDKFCTKEVNETLSMDRFNNADPVELSLGTKARAILIWLEADDTDKIEAYIISLEDLYRVIGRTAYLSIDTSSAAPESNYLII